MNSSTPHLRFSCLLLLLIFSSSTLLQSSADDSVTMFMIDSPSHHYLRSSPRIDEAMSAVEVGAALSVLLGVAPTPTLSPASSSKLNELLLPNPFDRPRHVLMLEIGLTEEMDYSDNTLFSGAIKSKVVRNDEIVQIDLPDTEEVHSPLLDGLRYGSDEDITDRQLSEFASSLGGSYVSGELIIPLPSGVKMTLHMSNKADKKFTAGMINLINSIPKVKEVTQYNNGGNSNLIEFWGGYFIGIKALQEEYGSAEITQLGMEWLLTTVSKAIETLQEGYEGKIVATILFSKAQSSSPQRMFEVTYGTGSESEAGSGSGSVFSPRLLAEVNTTSNVTAVAEMALVRGTLAWMTGLVLIIATLIGVYLLFNMPVTRDTLLYCNVKLD